MTRPSQEIPPEAWRDACIALIALLALFAAAAG